MTKSTSDLALFGGEKFIKTNFSTYNSIGQEELDAAAEVIKSGVLSGFIGRGGEAFLGGEKVRAFEKACEDYFDVKYAISVNSWTSGLIVAVGALDINPGDEIIVPPWTMCASATAILHWNAIPVFADIDPETFCISPSSIEANISPQTKAIMSVDIGGHPSDSEAINKIAASNGLKVISDTAQSPGVFYKGKMAGTLSDIGGYSFNYHKHVHTGEGGMLVTDDARLAERMRLIRNHAEAVVGDIEMNDIANMLGFNFRLGEIEAAIGLEQLKKLQSAVESRQLSAHKLSAGLHGLPGLKTPKVSEGCTHAYYMYFMTIDAAETGVSRDRIYEALVAEGVPSLGKSFANLHLLPLFQRKIAYGSHGFPWSSDICRRVVSYEKGICPVAENLHDKTYIGFQMCMHSMGDEEVNAVVGAFRKVWANLSDLT